MRKSTTSKKSGKAKKLPPDFPLWIHPSGRWCKKVRGRAFYFGKVADDPTGEKALDKWNEVKDDLLAGRTPRKPGDDRLTVGDLGNRFLTAKFHRMESGDLSGRSFRDYKHTCTSIVSAFGAQRALADLGPADFEALLVKLSTTKHGKPMGPVRVGNEVNRVRIIFRYAVESELIEKVIRFGPHFKRPANRVLRLARKAKGARMLEAAELRRVLDKATQPLRSMMLLGANCGLGASDCGRLRFAHLDLESGWLDFPRPKTGVDRRCPLWPETVDALREVITNRPKPKNPADADLVFVTRYGNPWVRMSPAKQDKDGDYIPGVPLDSIGQKFGNLLDTLGLKRPGLSFYCLRHGVETIGSEAKDQVALDCIMGHDRGDMARLYRERIDDDRLRAVTEHVRVWLFGTKVKR